MTSVTSLEERHEKFISIFVIFSFIERMIELVLDGHNIKYNQNSFGDKVEKFKLYLDRRQSKTINSDDKAFNDGEYSLDDILKEVQKYRNIVAHEAGFLFYDIIEEIPIARPGLRLKRKKYRGNLEELHDQFMKYANMIVNMYEMTSEIGSNVFEVFDINGQQIGTY